MMKSIAMRAVRRTLLLRSTSATASRVAAADARAFFGASTWTAAGEDEQPALRKFKSAHVDADIPDADYYKGHLMADHLEYLDDVLEKTVELEESMQDLHDTHEKKKAVYTTIGWTDSAEMEELFQNEEAKKAALQRQIDELKEIVASAKRSFAVDAPDGMPDGYQQEELKEINHIIEEAALREDGDAIMRERAAVADNRRAMGVDAPDGQPDAVDYEDLEQAKEIIMKAAEFKELILQQRELDRQNGQVLGVDAPDGEPDSLNQEELLAIKYIIDEAAKHEDREKIDYSHRMQKAVRLDRARDPEHDW